MQLECKNISKSFPGVRALNRFNILIRPGEIHAICGENGAGKTTFLNILTGNTVPDEGEILIDGKPVIFHSAKEAFEKGIRIVYQHLSLIDSLSIAENIFGSFPLKNKYGFILRSKMNREAGSLLKKLNLDFLDVTQKVQTLRPGEKQLVEIAKALISQPKVIFFDEPTASVSEQDAQTVLNIITQLKSQQVAIVYISHRLHEIFQIADIMTVLKDGHGQGSFSSADLDEKKLVRLMIGREIKEQEESHADYRDSLLEITQMSGPGFSGINLSLHRGEIIGFAGLVGSGRTEIARTIFGAICATAGQIKLKGSPILFFKNPHDAIRNRIGYIPDDRKSNGIFGKKTITENICVTALTKPGLYDPKSATEKAKSLCTELNIRSHSVDQMADKLSGGNQQKLLIARWLGTDAEILILDEPTHGIDIGARFEVYRIIRKFVASGKAVIVISSELNELLYLCDHILVIKEGKCRATLKASATSEEEIISLAM